MMTGLTKALVFAWTLSLVATPPLQAQVDSVLIAANYAACRQDPSLDAAVSTRLMVGDIGEPVQTRAGWTEVVTPVGPCWVFGSLLVAYAPGLRSGALITAAQLMMEREPRPSAEDFASLGVLVEDQIQHNGEVASLELQLARLRLLDAAGNPTGAVPDWVREHQDIMWYYAPAETWTVSREAYQVLYERYQEGPSGEELAWEYLRRSRPVECEDDPNCWLGTVEQSWMEYWELFPNGPYVGEALSRAHSFLGVVYDYACWTGEDDYTVVPEGRLDALEASLDAVTDVQREPIVALIDSIRSKCGR